MLAMGFLLLQSLNFTVKVPLARPDAFGLRPEALNSQLESPLLFLLLDCFLARAFLRSPLGLLNEFLFLPHKLLVTRLATRIFRRHFLPLGLEALLEHLLHGVLGVDKPLIVIEDFLTAMVVTVEVCALRHAAQKAADTSGKSCHFGWHLVFCSLEY